MHSTVGIVLNKTDVGEAETVFSIFTKDFGKIRALGQGIKKQGAKLKGHLEVLNLSAVHFVVGRYGERMVGAEMVQGWESIRGDLIKLKCAWHIKELVDRSLFERQCDEPLWNFLSANFIFLEEHPMSGASIHEFVQSFEEKFLSLMGYDGEENIETLGVARANFPL